MTKRMFNNETKSRQKLLRYGTGYSLNTHYLINLNQIMRTQ